VHGGNGSSALRILHIYWLAFHSYLRRRSSKHFPSSAYEGHADPAIAQCTPQGLHGMLTHTLRPATATAPSVTLFAATS
jgi:hypothetical protein